MKTVGFIAPTMICRHGAGDRDCSKNGGGYVAYQREESKRERESKTPDKKNYSIESVARIDKHLVMKVLYPNCSKCSYEGNKVLVFLNVSELEALKWKEIDPHFADPKNKRPSTQAPSPAARFPASVEGWDDAIAYARSKK